MDSDVVNKPKLKIWVAGVIAVLVALGAAWWLTRDTPSDSVEVSAVSVSVDGPGLAVFEGNGLDDPVVGSSAPSLKGVSPSGEKVLIDVGDGKPKLVVFLAHWCPVCQAEVPNLVEWIDGETGVEVYGVATAVDPKKGNYPPGVWLNEAGWLPPVLLDDTNKSAASAYGLNAFPFVVAVDSEGRVTSRASGALTREEFDGMLESALTGVPYQVGVNGAQTKASK